jgi:acetylglutamate kinase
VRLLIKIGGTLLDSSVTRQSLARQIADLQRRNFELVVVHGGGKQMTRFLEERGISSRFINGLRVTTPETMDAVLKVLAGSVNQELVAALIAHHAHAVGLSGIDGNLVEAEQMNAELGAVGRIVGCHPELLNLLAANHYLPVVACVAGDGRGGLFNINADQMAVACAVGFRANRIIFLTDVEGVLDGNGAVAEALSGEDARRLVDSGVAKGGMQAKLNAALSALDQGVETIHIVSGVRSGILNKIVNGEQVGSTMGRTQDWRIQPSQVAQ